MDQAAGRLKRIRVPGPSPASQIRPAVGGHDGPGDRQAEASRAILTLHQLFSCELTSLGAVAVATGPGAAGLATPK
jgi:hypothetical protein